MKRLVRALAPAVLVVTSLAACGGGHEAARPPEAVRAPAPVETRMGVMERQGGGSWADAPARAAGNDGERAAPESADAATITCADGASAAMALPSRGAVLGVRADGTEVPAESIALRTGMIRVPPGAVFTSSTEVSELGAFPEEVQQAGGGEKTVEAAIAVHGTRRTYRSDRSYAGTVEFFDRALGTYGFQSSHRVAAGEAATVWLARCRGGETVHVIVRDASPPTIEVVEAVVK